MPRCSLRSVLCSILILLFSSLVAHAEAPLQKIRFGFSGRAITPIIVNILIAEKLGFYKEEGLTMEVIPLGSNAATMQALQSKRVEFGAGTAAFHLPVVAKGENVPLINYFEFTYPFKYAMAVKPDSAVTAFPQLKGKRIGISKFGVNEYPIGKALLALSNVDPEKDVTWLAVGEGVTAGIALKNGAVDALIYDDTGFGTIEAAGIPIRYLAIPGGVPEIGGVFIQSHVDTLKEHRDWAVGFARAVAKSSVFVQRNPEAAAYAFIEMFPQAAPKGVSIQQQVKAIQTSVVKRMPLYSPYDKSITKWGYIKGSEWEAEVKFADLEGKVGDLSRLYTNDLIDDINRFDADAIRKFADQYPLPYK